MATLDAEARLVLDAMKQANKELKSAQIAELTGIPKDKVSKIISKLKKMDLVFSPKRCYYKAK